MKEAPRVLHLLSGDLWAGAEVMAHNLLTGLHSSEGCEVLAVLLNEGRVAESLRREGIQVKVLDESRLSFPRLLSGLRRILQDFRPGIIHAHRYKENLLAYLASRFIRGVSLVANQHGMPERHGGSTLKSRFIHWMNHTLLKTRFDRLVAVSGEMKDSLVKKGFNPNKIPVIHNGIDLPENPHQAKRPAGSFIVGSCGRLFPVKNYDLFVETAARVTQQSPEACFELAGDGPQMERLRMLCSQHNLNGNFAFLGQVRDMSRFYSELDVYMSTSIHEGIPMSVLEAMGHGLPVVAPRVGGFPEIVDHGVDGFLIPEHDPELFAQACLHLQSDSRLLARMSKAARDKVESRFSVQRMSNDYMELYQGITARLDCCELQTY